MFFKCGEMEITSVFVYPSEL